MEGGDAAEQFRIREGTHRAESNELFELSIHIRIQLVLLCHLRNRGVMKNE